MTTITKKLIINKKIKLALIGCGRISKNHIKAIANERKRTILVALCDLNQNAIDEKKLLYKNELYNLGEEASDEIITFNSFDKFIEKCQIDINFVDLVILCTPSGLHPYQTNKIANCGIHVCTEKPMATKWEDGVKMVEECQKNNVYLFVVKQNRFNKTLQLLKKQLLNNRFGKIYLVNINVFWQRPQTYYDQSEWRGTKLLDGGALMNQASHYVDLLDWLFGTIISVSANIATLARDIESEDTATMQLRWKEGALGSLSVTMLTYPENIEGSLTVIGEKGTVKLGGKAVNEIKYWEFSDKSDDDKEIEKANYETTSVYGFGHPPYYKNMLDSLQGKDYPYCDGNDGLKSLELITAAYKSSHQKLFIDLPLTK